MTSGEGWIEKLKLRPTGVGGHFASTFESDSELLSAALPERFEGDRRFYSANYFLLNDDEVLRLHSLNQDELWYYFTGSAVRLHVFSDRGTYEAITLGADLERGQVLQARAPHNRWFGAERLSPGTFSLVHCSLSPGFDPRDSTPVSPEKLAELKRSFPEHAGLLDRLTGRPKGK